MSRYLMRLKISTALFMLILGLGIPIPTMGCPQPVTVRKKPGLINLYYAELGRSHCDHLTVAVLQGSKEGHVIDMFPPGRTKNMPKEGHVVAAQKTCPKKLVPADE